MRSTIILLALVLFSQKAWTTTTENRPIEDFMVEFCVATLLVTGNEAEAAIWRKRYTLEEVVISYFENQLRWSLEAGHSTPQDLIEAADGCKQAHQEASDE